MYNALSTLLRLSDLGNVALTQLFGYFAFVRLFDACDFVMSGSNRIKKNAPSQGKCVLVLTKCTRRNVIERSKLVAVAFWPLVLDG